MASYFVACHAQPDGIHPVHDRSRCPPDCFPEAATEYLGEFGNTRQAVAVARVRYGLARGCVCCDPARATWAAASRLTALPLTSLRS